MLKNEAGKLTTTPLTATTLPETIKKQHPHLAGFKAYQHQLTKSEAKAWLKQQTFVLAGKESINHVAYTQTGFVLDALYAGSATLESQLGAHVIDGASQFKLWAPTAQKVEVLVFNGDKTPAATVCGQANGLPRRRPHAITRSHRAGGWPGIRRPSPRCAHFLWAALPRRPPRSCRRP